MPGFRNAGRINILVLLGLVALGGLAAWFYLARGGNKAKDETLQKVEGLVDRAGKAIEKNTAETAEELERRNKNIQSKRGFDVTK